MSKYVLNQAQLLTGVVVMAGGVLLSVWPSYAGFKPPGDLQKPGNRRGLATRLFEPRKGPLNESAPRKRPDGVVPIPLPSPEAPIWDSETDSPPNRPTRGTTCVAEGKPTLTTLVPKSNIGLSASAFPTFYWFTPTNSYKIVQFSLRKVNPANNSVEEVYSSTFQSSGKAGLSSVSLPTQITTVTLEAGVDYQWQVGLYCSKQKRQGLVANGWIRYVPPTDRLAKQLTKSKPRDQADGFAEAGYWYDAVRVLALARQTQPENARLAQAWKTLLASKPVQLPEIATQN